MRDEGVDTALSRPARNRRVTKEALSMRRAMLAMVAISLAMVISLVAAGCKKSGGSGGGGSYGIMTHSAVSSTLTRR
jgi:uncharacterized membrane protein